MKLFGSFYLLFSPKDLNNEMRIRYTSKFQPKAGQGFDCRQLKKQEFYDDSIGIEMNKIHSDMLKLDCLIRLRDTKQSIYVRRHIAEQAIKYYAEPIGPFDKAITFWTEQETAF